MPRNIVTKLLGEEQMFDLGMRKSDQAKESSDRSLVIGFYCCPTISPCLLESGKNNPKSLVFVLRHFQE
jgi:hypothetical protein